MNEAAVLKLARERVTGFLRGSDRSGSRSTALYTAAVDNSCRELCSKLQQESPAESFCLIATGGYARRSLCTWSDVDVVLLRRDPSSRTQEELARALLYPLWDAGLDVGCHPGSIAEVLALAEADLATRTSLLDLRFLGGDLELYESFKAAIEGCVESWGRELLGRVRAANLARFNRYGASVFLLEPQVKEGKGGLRDFDWLCWIARLRHGARGDYDMLLRGVVEPQHYRELADAREFLLRVRLQLHVLHGRREDRLVFESQEPVARALGFKASGGLLAVERFMGEYYRHAYAMAHLCGLYVARMLGFYWDEEHDHSSVGEPLELGPSAPVVRSGWELEERSADELFLLQRGSVRCVDPAALSREPRTIMTLFEFVQGKGARLHHDTLEQVRGALPRINKRFREDREISGRFFAMLEGDDVFRALVAMHRSGFLGRYIPEWAACFCQAQHNRLHLYTVDVHLLYTVRELEALGSDELEVEFAEVRRAWGRRERRAPLLLAGLFHDVAKTHGTAHSRVGAEQVSALLGRMGASPEDQQQVAWLVRHHLTLSNVAYFRDLRDPKTLSDLAAIVPSRAHLDDLLALSWADASATNPSSFTSWRKTLLLDAYRAALQVVEPEQAGGPLSLEQKRAQVEALLLPEVGRKRASQLAALVFEVPVASQPRYLDSPSELLASHAALLAQHQGQQGSEQRQDLVCHARHRPAAGISQWMVCTRDEPGTFSTQAGVLAACGLSIVSAQAVTRRDGACINSFSVTDARGRAVADPARWRRVQRTLTRVMSGERGLGELLARARHHSGAAVRAGDDRLKRIEVSNELSDQATVVEVVTDDRVGLVHDITRVFLERGLDLQVAKIATRHDLASDAFYVVNRFGRKLGRKSCRDLATVLEERFA
ncbi:MAG: [protein-PII] uridylyltransferase [Rickettsiales bacterium]|nr:[protein-PII] uridylyltransferase [Rickettsiales bacterium]